MILPHLGILTQRFWPLAGSESVVARRLAAAWGDRARVSVLTSGVDPLHGPRLRFCGANVSRLGPPPDSFPAWQAYLEQVEHWLRRRADALDGLLLLEPDHQLPVVRRILGRASVPVAVRCERAPAAAAQLARGVLPGETVLVTQNAVQRELVDQGWPPDRIVHVDDAVPEHPESPGADPTERRTAARIMLSAVSSRPLLDRRDPLAMFVGRLAVAQGPLLLVQALRQVTRWLPQARLALVGDGPDRDLILREIDRGRLGDRVWAIPPLDDPRPLLSAADLVVAPALQPRSALVVREAQAASVPVMASDHALHRSLLGSDGLTFRNGDCRDLQSRLADALSRPDTVPRPAARSTASGFRRMVDAYFEASVGRLRRQDFSSTGS